MVLASGTMTSIFPNSAAFGDGFGGDTQQGIIWTDVGVGIIPIGGITAWCKTLIAGTTAATLLPQYVECNGQVLSDGDSPLNGLTIPNLNGSGATTQYFMRGSTTSGTTGGNDSLTHNHHSVNNNKAQVYVAGTGYFFSTADRTLSTLPSYYEIVWVMRIK